MMRLVPNFKQLVESLKLQYREYSLLRIARESEKSSGKMVWSEKSILKIFQINVAEIRVKIGQQTAIFSYFNFFTISNSISKFIIIQNLRYSSFI